MCVPQWSELGLESVLGGGYTHTDANTQASYKRKWKSFSVYVCVCVSNGIF